MRRLPTRATLGLAAAALIAAGVFLAYAALDLGSGGGAPAAEPQVQEAPTEAPQPSPTPASLPRIVIPKIGVDAPVVEKGLRADRVMESPDGPWEVAWYRFTARPGEGGNAVFSGHVDYVGVGPAVFWELDRLQTGDEVEVHWAEGVTVRYRVVSSVVYDEATAPVPEIIGPTAREAVTLITCAGNFNRRTGRYDQRLVVRAERVPDGT
ncbi:MAG TPA: class F sortase [Dehalococcoidia bacterium]